GGAARNLVQGNFISTNADGTTQLPIVSTGANNEGVSILDAPNNTIGGTTAGAGNVITTVKVRNPGATGNLVQGNFIGIDVTGTTPLASDGNGVTIVAAPSTTIGGTTPGARNVISGNVGGIFIAGSARMDTLVQGNYIGTDASGVAAVPNG